MNNNLKLQILNMKITVKTFQRSCQVSAMKDDGTIDKEEAKTLKQINAAAEKFLSKLENIG